LSCLIFDKTTLLEAKYLFTIIFIVVIINLAPSFLLAITVVVIWTSRYGY